MPLLIIGAVLVLVLVAVVGFVVLGDDDEPSRRLTLPTTSIPFTSTPSADPTAPGLTDMNGVLKPTVSTAAGTTFTRAGTIRSGSCITRADADLLKALRINSCVQNMESALYTNPARSIVTVVSVLKFSDSSAASAVSDATSAGANPALLLPPPGSGLPALSRNPSTWNRSWSRGDYVVYAQGYNVNGGDPGGRTGTVFTTAGDIGVEIANVLNWKN